VALLTVCVTLPKLALNPLVPPKHATIVWLEGVAVRVEVVKVAWPLPLSAVGPERVVPGRAQVPPSMKVTLPVVTGVTPTVTVAVKITDWPYVDGLRLEANVVLVVAIMSNAAVNFGLLPVKVKGEHGLVVPAQPLMLEAPLHPAKNEPPLAFAVIVPVAELLLNVILGQVVVTV
jgi:hypothetical protein